MGRDRSRSMSSSSSGRGLQAKKWDGKSGYRLHVSDLAAGISRKEIERVFGKYGSINEVWVAMNPPCFAFVNFTHRTDAENALREVDGKVIGSTRVGVKWARERTFGGRNRRTQRRSRSRSPSYSRREKHRSRSKDRRRSRSPRDRKRSRRTSEEKNSPIAKSRHRSDENVVRNRSPSNSQ